MLTSIVMASAALTVAACGDESDGTSASADDCAKEPVTVGLVPKLNTDPHFATAREGAEEAAEEIGGSVVQQAPSQATGDAQIEFINNMISQQVGVIAIAGNDPNAVAPALKRAEQQGIKVIAYDSDVAPDARALFINQASSQEIGEKLLDSMAELIDGTGKFAVLSSTPTATNQNAWIKSMRERLENDPAFKDMELVKVVYGQENEQTNRQQTLSLVQAYPDLKGIIVPAGIGLPAAARALEQSGSDRQGQADGPGAGLADEEVHPVR